MDRTTPVAHNEEIELYLRTYYSLLRSSEPIRLRSLEETHAAMNSTLHHQAAESRLDVSALAYSALRLPNCIIQTELMVMGQMDDVFEREGYAVESWQPVRARARRRKFFFDAEHKILAAFVASVSDIDDLIPCLVGFQIEWNKMHYKLRDGTLAGRLQQHTTIDYVPMHLLEEIRQALELDSENLTRLCQIWPGNQLVHTLLEAVEHRMDLRVRVLGSGLSDYRRSVQIWWQKVEEKSRSHQLTQRPIYFVSSNTHSLINLVTGYAWDYKAEILDFVKRKNPEGLWNEYQHLPTDNSGHLRNFLYYTFRLYLADDSCPSVIQKKISERENGVGLTRISEPHCLDVEGQVFDLAQLIPQHLDPRLQIFCEEEWALLRQSDALIYNIDYPLGMAAYHIFSQVTAATVRLLGVYILGKAATLNGRVGDVMMPNVVYDEHSRNSYLFRNCFTAQDVAPYLYYGSVFDNQKAVTVRGTYLQNREFMDVFYEEGYTDIEMEAGPYLSAIYEDIYPRRYPVNEIVNLFINAPYDIGLIHYASDTPISKRQSLLSKSMSYFGVDATYATSIAVVRRILEQEVARQRHTRRMLLLKQPKAQDIATSNGVQHQNETVIVE
ncbi:hypothetical protein KFU94_08405 [Chloroflexi bacterium TSY]|nr:hypothetical protein [Chloroflexi bacterium TSY]